MGNVLDRMSSHHSSQSKRFSRTSFSRSSFTKGASGAHGKESTKGNDQPRSHSTPNPYPHATIDNPPPPEIIAAAENGMIGGALLPPQPSTSSPPSHLPMPSMPTATSHGNMSPSSSLDSSVVHEDEVEDANEHPAALASKTRSAPQLGREILTRAEEAGNGRLSCDWDGWDEDGCRHIRFKGVDA